MKKIINIGLLLTFPLIYYDLGHDGGNYIGLAEFELLQDLINLQSPLLLFIVIAQILITLGIFAQDKIYNILTITGIAILNIIAILILFVDLITNAKTFLTGIPFLFITFMFAYRYIQNNETTIFPKSLNK